MYYYFSQKGEVLTAFFIDKKGMVSDIQILEPSGYPELDRAARESIMAGQPYLPYPPGVRSSLRVKFSVKFRLNR